MMLLLLVGNVQTKYPNVIFIVTINIISNIILSSSNIIVCNTVVTNAYFKTCKSDSGGVIVVISVVTIHIA